MTDLARLLGDTACRHAVAGGAAWFAAQTTFGPAFAAAGRKLGAGMITEADAAAITAAGLRWPVTPAADCARAALVLREVAQLPAAGHVDFVGGLLRRGEVRERCAVLRVLAALPEPARFVDVAIDAYRTNIQDVFEALACSNAYPGRHFPAAAFDQMVLKALFTGAPVAAIAGLGERTTPELVRMVEAYASERRAAGREVPADVTLIRREP